MYPCAPAKQQPHQAPACRTAGRHASGADAQVPIAIPAGGARLRAARPLGVYLNLVEGRLWVPAVAGSNPATPTNHYDLPKKTGATRRTAGFFACELRSGQGATCPGGRWRPEGPPRWRGSSAASFRASSASRVPEPLRRGHRLEALFRPLALRSACMHEAPADYWGFRAARVMACSARAIPRTIEPPRNLERVCLPSR
jgi:hypothetical protein